MTQAPEPLRALIVQQLAQSLAAEYRRRQSPTQHDERPEHLARQQAEQVAPGSAE